MSDIDQKDFNLKIKVRNARLIRAMRKCGMKTGADLARAAGVSTSAACCMIGMEISPYASYGNFMFTGVAQKIAAAVNEMPSDLWPERLREFRAKAGGAEIEVSADQVAALISPEGGMEDRLLHADLIQKLLPALTDRQAKVIIKLFGIGGGALTLDEVGEQMGISKERVRQLKLRALRKMEEKALTLGVRRLT